MKTVNTKATAPTTVFDFNLDALASAVKSAKHSLKVAKSKLDAVPHEPVYSTVRESLTNELRIALDVVRKAQDQYAIAAGNLKGDEPMFDRCIVEDVTFDLSSDTLDNLIAKKEEESEKEDQTTIDRRRLIFGLIGAINTNLALDRLAAVDARYGLTGNDHELLVRRIS